MDQLKRILTENVAKTRLKLILPYVPTAFSVTLSTGTVFFQRKNA